MPKKPKKTLEFKFALNSWDYIFIIFLLLVTQIYLSNAGRADLWPDEARESYQSYLLAKNNFNVFATQLFHPPLIYLVIATLFSIFGPQASVAQWVVPLFSVLGLLAIYVLGTMIYDRKVGFLSAVLLSTNWVYMFYSSRILTDVPVTMTITFAIAAFYYVLQNRRRDSWILFALSLLLAFLTKSQAWLIILGILIYAVINFFLLASKHGVNIKLLDEPQLNWVRDKHFLVLVGLSFLFITVWIALNPGFIMMWLGGFFSDIKGKSIEANLDPLYYITNLPNYLFTILDIPVVYSAFALLIMASVYLSWKADQKKFIFLFSFILGFLLVISAWGYKDYRYILPMYPLFYVLIASLFNNLSQLYEQFKNYFWVFLFVILAISYMDYNVGSSFIAQKAAGYYGYKEAADFLLPLLGPNETIIATSHTQMTFYLLRPTIFPPANSTELERIISEKNIRYIEFDPYEWTQPQYFIQYLAGNQNKYQLVQAILEPTSQAAGQPTGTFIFRVVK